MSIIFNFLSKIKTEKYHIPSVLLEKMLGMISPICKEFVGSSYIFAKYFAVLSSSSDYHGQCHGVASQHFLSARLEW